MELFRSIDFETISTCNRTCPTCLRNSHPNKKEIGSWFEKHYLPIDIIKLALEQTIEMGFTGWVCLSHFNEPTMDERLPEIAQMVRKYNNFSRIFLNTNGDYLNENLAGNLDGILDRIIVTLYMDEPIKSRRANWIKTLFKQTEVQINPSEHIPSHYSPGFDVKALSEKYLDSVCREPATRVIINHRQQFLLCCEDVIGNFSLGKFPDKSISEYWFGDRHREIHDNLLENGGRRKHPYCSICPKS